MVSPWRLLPLAGITTCLVVAGCHNGSEVSDDATVTVHVYNDLPVAATVYQCGDTQCRQVVRADGAHVLAHHTASLGGSPDLGNQSFQVRVPGRPIQCVSAYVTNANLNPRVSLSAAKPCASITEPKSQSNSTTAIGWALTAVLLLVGIAAWVIGIFTGRFAYRWARSRGRNPAVASAAAIGATLATVVLLYPFVALNWLVVKLRHRPKNTQTSS